MSKAIFITATDTSVGKTIVSSLIGLALKRRGASVGVMKPFQSAGDDAEFLIKTLGIKDKRDIVNPYYTKEPLAPHVAFKRAQIRIDLDKVFDAYRQLRQNHEFLIVEGAGGLLVPITEDYLMSDFIRDLDIPTLIVARSGLGTINHTLLTQRYALDSGIRIKGIIINGSRGKDLSEKTNPIILKSLLDVPLLGVIPYVKNVKHTKNLSRLSKKIGNDMNIDALFSKEGTCTKKLAENDKKFLWHPFTQMKDWINDSPLIIEEARGSYLKDTEGRWYLDGVSSLWVNVHGHRKKEIDSAIRKQLNKVAHSTLLGLANVPSIELASKLVKIVEPLKLGKVFYSDSGSTAIEIAIKIAYQYWKNKGLSKKKFIHLDNSYHGDTIGSVSVGGIDLFHRVYNSLLFETLKVDSPYCYRCPVGKHYPGCGFECLNKLKKTLRLHQREVAALIVEPVVQAAAGMLVWPGGIYKEIHRICKKYGCLLIADEVAVGFGRTGAMFASGIEGISPDILCLAKGITAGYLPLAVTMTTNEIFNSFLGEYKEQKTFFHGHTYTGNPLACMAALANLEVFKKDKTLRKLKIKIAFLKEQLKRFNNLKHVGDIRQKGFMVGIELVKNKQTKEEYAFEDKIGIKVCFKARDYGVILRPLGNVIVIMPPLSISKEELVDLLNAAYKAIDFITESA